MKMERYDALFEQYLLNIAPTKTQIAEIDDALCEASALFLSTFDDVELYTQGSYATGTLVKPLTATQSLTGVAGDYDIDIAIQREKWRSACSAMDATKNILEDFYDDQLDSKKHESCVRVYHSTDSSTGVVFHADYVPILLKENEARIERCAAKYSKNIWFQSDTKKQVEWFLDFAKENPFVRALIMIMKRIRDVAGKSKIFPSVCILAIIYEHYDKQESYLGDLLFGLDAVIKELDKPFSGSTYICLRTKKRI